MLETFGRVAAYAESRNPLNRRIWTVRGFLSRCSPAITLCEGVHGGLSGFCRRCGLGVRGSGMPPIWGPSAPPEALW